MNRHARSPGACSSAAEHVDAIEQSHERCAALGVSRIERPDHAPLGRTDLAVARERNLRLHAHAAPVMEMLYEQIVNTQSMVVLTDANGTIVALDGRRRLPGSAPTRSRCSPA